MTVHFPRGYKCSDYEREVWPEMERRMLPFIKAKANRIKRWVNGVDYEDAVQEGRMALLAALSKYDCEKGELEPYIGRVLDNTYKSMLYEMLCASRMPRAVIRDAKNKWVQIPVPPLSLHTMLQYGNEGHQAASYEPPSGIMTPEDGAKFNELEAQAAIFRMKMLYKLKGRDKRVFECRTNPPVSLLKMVQNLGGDIANPTNLHIAEYLGVDKNAVDWSLYKIKGLFTEMARRKEFSDLFGDIIVRKGWPMIHVSKKPCHDTDFVGKIIKERKLDPKPIKGYHSEPDFHQQANDGTLARMIERYPWGCVLVLKRKQLWRTFVIEGRFNPLTGDVFGDDGMRETLPVKWYRKMARELNSNG